MMLPLPKTKMKVLLKVLYAKEQNKEKRAALENGFIFLSKFQDGIGPRPIDGMLGHVMDDANIEAFERWLAWENLSAQEMEILITEWKRFQQGEPI
jgi:hypothetical protein